MGFDPVTTALSLGGRLIDRLWPDPEKKAAAQLELIKLQQSGELSIITQQLEINKAEATNPSVFVSGWRPGVGWTCVAGLAIQFIINPLATWGASLAGNAIVFPTIDTATLLTMLGALLGIGGLRTYEKVSGVASK